MHADLIQVFGGTAGVRNEALLASSIAAPLSTFGSEELFPALTQKAARLGFGLVSNHPFFDGNKSVVVHAMLVLLALNRVEVTVSNDELVRIGLALAQGLMGHEDLAEWISNAIQTKSLIKLPCTTTSKVQCVLD